MDAQEYAEKSKAYNKNKDSLYSNFVNRHLKGFIEQADLQLTEQLGEEQPYVTIVNMTYKEKGWWHELLYVSDMKGQVREEIVRRLCSHYTSKGFITKYISSLSLELKLPNYTLWEHLKLKGTI